MCHRNTILTAQHSTAQHSTKVVACAFSSYLNNVYNRVCMKNHFKTHSGKSVYKIEKSSFICTFFVEINMYYRSLFNAWFGEYISIFG